MFSSLEIEDFCSRKAFVFEKRTIKARPAMTDIEATFESLTQTKPKFQISLASSCMGLLG
jgi:hypothetical protein